MKKKKKKKKVCSIDSIHGQRNPHRERGLAGMGNGCFAEFCCCVPLCPCVLRYSSSKDISFHRFPGDKVAGRECIFKSRRDMPKDLQVSLMWTAAEIVSTHHQKKDEL